MVSIKQIAADIGVSAATVSNALTGKGRVSEEMAQRIRARAEALGYRPNVTARALKSGQTGILGLVMPDLTNPLFPRIAQSLSDAADERRLGILIADSRGSAGEQRNAMKRLIDRGVDGLLVVPQKGSAPEAPGVPMVVINTASDPQNTVSSDHVGGGTLIGAHIAEQGHRSVVLLGGDAVSEVQQDRISGMRTALEGRAEVTVAWGTEGIAALPQLIAEGATAILATSDLLALQVQSALAQAGLSVPGDVSLTGFDDLPLASAMHPTLTTVAQDVPEIARRAIEAFCAQIAGAPTPAAGETVPTRLVQRASTRSLHPTDPT